MLQAQGIQMVDSSVVDKLSSFLISDEYQNGKKMATILFLA